MAPSKSFEGTDVIWHSFNGSSPISGSLDARRRTTKQGCMLRSTTPRSRSQIKGTFSVGRWAYVASLNCPPIAGTKHSEIRVKLRYMYSSTVPKRSRRPVVVGNRVSTLTESSSVYSPFTASATKAAHEYACSGGALFSYRKIPGLLSPV